MYETKNNTLIIYIIIIIPTIIFPPLFIFTITALFLLWRSKINYRIPFFIALAAIIIALFFPSFLIAITNDYTIFFSRLIQDTNKIEVIIQSIFAYSFYSYIWDMLLGIVLSSLLLWFADRKNILLMNLDDTLIDVSKNNEAVRNECTMAETYNIAHETLIGTCRGKYITVNDDARHVFICGTTGSGKTVMIGNFIENACLKNYPLLIVDGKGDYGKDTLLDIVNHFKGDRPVYIFNMAEPENSAKYNPFNTDNPTICKDMLINITTWSEEHYKANTERYIQRVIQVLMKHRISLSFATLIKALNPETLTKISMNGVKEKIISKEEHLETMEIINTSGKIAQAAAARFITIAESSIGSLFADDGISIYEALSQNAIILFILNPLLYPELAPALGKLILVDAKQAIARLFRAKKERTFFIFDEIQSYASPALIDLVNKSRSANVTCIAATQSLADLEALAGSAFQEQIIENCNNYIIMRQNSANSAEKWSEILGTIDAMEMTYQLGEKNQQVYGTGYGSARRVREFLYHPDVIKRLPTGKAIYMSKDNNKHALFDGRKGF